VVPAGVVPVAEHVHHKTPIYQPIDHNALPIPTAKLVPSLEGKDSTKVVPAGVISTPDHVHHKTPVYQPIDHNALPIPTYKVVPNLEGKDIQKVVPVDANAGSERPVSPRSGTKGRYNPPDHNTAAVPVVREDPRKIIGDQ